MSRREQGRHAVSMVFALSLARSSFLARVHDSLLLFNASLSRYQHSTPLQPCIQSSGRSGRSGHKRGRRAPSPTALGVGPEAEAERERKQEKRENRSSEKNKAKENLFLTSSSPLCFDQRRVSLDQGHKLGEALGGGGKHLGPVLRKRQKDSRFRRRKSEVSWRTHSSDSASLSIPRRC